MIRLWHVIPCAVIISLSSTVASALTITQTQGFIGRPNLNKPVEFAKFDPSYGTLQGVGLRFDLHIEGGSLIVDNDGQQPAQVQVKLGAVGSLASADVHLVDSLLNPIASGASEVIVSTGTTLNLLADNGDGSTLDSAPPDAGSHAGGVASAFASGSVSSNFFGDYIGTDMFTIHAKISQLLDFGGVGGISGQFEPVLSEANITLTYDYVQGVPEPSTWLGAVLSGLVLWRVRRRVTP